MDASADSGCGEQCLSACSESACEHGMCVTNGQATVCECWPGYSGDRCTVDDCASKQCANGMSCVHTEAGVACKPACSGTCEPGEACNVDSDCAGIASVCHPVDHVCLEPCGTITIVSEHDLETHRFCFEAAGDLVLQPNFSEITADDLPYLTHVGGSIKGANPLGGASHLRSLTLAALETLGGGIKFAELGLITIDMPKLTSVGHGVELLLLSTENLSLPKLTTVHGKLSIALLWNLRQINLHSLREIRHAPDQNGDLTITGAEQLTSLDMPNLTDVAGQVNLAGLPRLPWPAVSYLDNGDIASSRTFQEVGCCYVAQSPKNCASFDPMNCN